MTTRKKGRPTTYNDELAKEICDAIASTNIGLKKLCKANSHWPSYDTIYRWLSAYSNFSDLYARAKQQQIEVLIDEILEIADNTAQDKILNDDGVLVVDHEHINRSRLRIDTRKWLAAKLCPRLYGDKVQHDGTIGITGHEEAIKAILELDS